MPKALSLSQSAKLFWDTWSPCCWACDQNLPFVSNEIYRMIYILWTRILLKNDYFKSCRMVAVYVVRSSNTTIVLFVSKSDNQLLYFVQHVNNLICRSKNLKFHQMCICSILFLHSFEHLPSCHLFKTPLRRFEWLTSIFLQPFKGLTSSLQFFFTCSIWTVTVFLFFGHLNGVWNRFWQLEHLYPICPLAVC